MLISFTLENWMSFRDPVTFSMVATRERQHGDRLSKLGKYQTRLLPIAAIYGGNASGKTNFFKGIRFAQNLVVNGTKPDGTIPVEPFRLDTSQVGRPSRLKFELLIDETIYEFSFAMTREAIVEEKLTLVAGTSEKLLYQRREGRTDFDGSLPEKQFLQFVFKGTRDNQLFLTNAISQKIDTFRPVYNWFKDTLQLVAPDSRFQPFERFFDEADPLYENMNDWLVHLDTGITHLGTEEIPFDNALLPEPLKAALQEDVREGETVHLQNVPLNHSFVVTRKNGELLARKLVTFHSGGDDTRYKFEFRQESDGSRRVIDLLPAFLELSARGSNKVYLIDEIDRSLHTVLTRRLLEAYLAGCSGETRTQLLLTTHDVLLMDQRLLRRDEMWVTERNAAGASTLLSFSEFKDVRYDKDIRKSYLQGRMGGIPRILSGGSLAAPGRAAVMGGGD
ncbi:MAG: ATP-binding protein [Methylobacteriaceae bacterium]|jgi:AAA15 family ATPase/GTPase|nr:ATP-binding protein [Methylobacteriaceae bacterium]